MIALVGHFIRIAWRGLHAHAAYAHRRTTIARAHRNRDGRGLWIGDLVFVMPQRFETFANDGIAHGGSLQTTGSPVTEIKEAHLEDHHGNECDGHADPQTATVPATVRRRRRHAPVWLCLTDRLAHGNSSTMFCVRFAFLRVPVQCRQRE